MVQCLVMGDFLTKWVNAVPNRNKKAITVAQKVVDRIVTIFGTLYNYTPTRAKPSSLKFSKRCAKSWDFIRRGQSIALSRTV